MSTGEDTRAATRALTGVFVALTLGLALARFLDADELEHVHATWLVLQGQVPFRDFFEHHHPLLWFTLAPVLGLIGESATTLVIFRALFFLLTLGIARATYGLAMECAASRAVARLAVVLLLSMTTFAGVAIEIRPDVPQMCFAVLSVLYAVRLVRTGTDGDAARSGAAAALSFLFLQKAVFVFAGYPVFFLYYLRRGRLTWRSALVFTVAFVATCAPALVYLVRTGSMDDYVISNWLVNANVGASGYRYSMLAPEVLRDAARNVVFWGLAGWVAVSSLRRSSLGTCAVPFWIGVTALGLIVVLNRVADRYVAATVPFLAIGAAAWLDDTAARLRVSGRVATAVLVIIVVIPAAATLRGMTRTNGEQLAQIRYVLDRTLPGDRVYDLERNVNVFRPDCDYYWFRVGPAPRLYTKYSGGRRQAPDVCRALSDAKPAFVYQRRNELAQCGMTGDYQATGVKDLFVRSSHVDPPRAR
jgi:hypothetical protein